MSSKDKMAICPVSVALDTMIEKRDRVISQGIDKYGRDAEAAGTTQAVPSSNSESIAVAGGVSSGHDAGFVTGMDSLYPDVNAIITENRGEDNDINSIFDVGKAPTSHAILFNAAHGGISSFAAASFRAVNALLNTEAALAAQLPPFPPSSNFDVDDSPM
ncbi:hypothetical protein BC332_23032 [Capsicum chinense]|nr:hypothetical protein BC332_23032 [Capsicum chinense]